MVGLEDVLGLPNTATKADLEGHVPQELVEHIAELAASAPEGNILNELSRSQFMQSLQQMQCSAFATLGTYRYLSDSELVKPKTNGTSGQIAKLSACQVVINSNYANAVTSAMGRECEVGETIADRFDVEEYEPAPHRFADRILGTGVYVHRDDPTRLYVQTHVIRSLGKTFWYFGGEIVERSEIDHMIHKRKEGQRQPQQRKVIWRQWLPASIVTVKITPNKLPRLTWTFTLTD